MSINIYINSKSTLIYVRNDSGLGKVNIEIDIDNVQVFKGDIRDFYIPDTAFYIDTHVGMQTLTMKTDGYEYKETFYPGIDRYISIEFGRISDFDDKKIGFFTYKSWSSMIFQ